MESEDQIDSQSLFSYPEIQELFKELLPGLVAESDRGAVLVGYAYVDEYLEKLFKEVAPSDLGNKRQKELLKYPGPLSSFSAKVEVAYISRLITRSLYDSLHTLRQLRNELAHTPTSFRLQDHMERIRKMYELGQGIPVAINRMALDVMMHLKVRAILDAKHPMREEPLFETPQEVIDYIADKPEIIETLDEQLPRYELAIAIALICALLVWFREAAKGVLANDLILASLVSNRKRPSAGDTDTEEQAGGEIGSEVSANPAARADS